MKLSAMLLLAVMVASCAAAPVAPPPGYLFKDQLFTAPSEGINADDVFAVSEEMRHYLRTEIADQLRIKGPQQGLIDAIYSRDLLKVEYDSARTRNAAQTFHERTGNCLSLVIMTAALAKELGLPVGFHNVVVDEMWARSGDLYFSVGHVNLTVGKRQSNLLSRNDDNALITIDFVPQGDTRGQRSRPLARETVVAMYMNNRAAEALAREQVSDAYWWARAAITQDPKFVSSYNTLGVVYRRHANLSEAEKVLNHALEREPDNVHVMSNLAMVLTDEGRSAEAQVLSAKVRQREPYPPFYFFDLGQTAMGAKDFKSARDFFAKEVARDAYNHEFHFWLAAAYSGLGEVALSRRHLAIAMEFSNTRKEHDLYAAKLARLNANK